jgi:hypothetical protein
VRKIIIFAALLVLLLIVIYHKLDGIPVGYKNQKLIILSYSCSDVCPQYGGWDKIYYGVSEKDCSKVGGTQIIDLAWGVYEGCSPE